VHTDLDAAERPEAGEEAVEVRARSSFGDMMIRRDPTPTNDPVRLAPCVGDAQVAPAPRMPTDMSMAGVSRPSG
jgi:hypothetical protein